MRVAVVGVWALLALPVGLSRAEVTAGVSAGEYKCQSAVRTALARQALAHLACVRTCERSAAKTGGPWDDCTPPSYGGATARCLDDGLGAVGKGAENRSLATMLAACPEDGAADTCPESYEETFGNCAAMAARRVSDDHGTFSIFTANVICEHVDLTTDPGRGRKQAKCQTAIGRALARHFDRVTAIYRRCNIALLKGRLGAGACRPGAVSDPKLSPGNAVPKQNVKTAAAIDHSCFTAKAVAPACYDGTPFRPDSGAGWVTLVNAYVESSVDGRTFVASPSGAFVRAPVADRPGAPTSPM